jgi:hypothetical protein
MVIADFSSIVGPNEPLPGPMRQRWNPANGIRLFASVYAKQCRERQDIVQFLPGFRPKDKSRDDPAWRGPHLDRLK